MGCHAALIVLLALGAGPSGSNAPGRIVLLDFYADWCGPCREMMPVVDQLAARGYPIRKVNFDQQRDLANRLGVKAIPTFVMLVDGRVVDRQVGATSMGRLEQMFQRAAAAARASGTQLAGSTPSPSREAAPGDSGHARPTSGAATANSHHQTDTGGWRLVGIDRLRGALSKLRPRPASKTTPETATAPSAPSAQRGAASALAGLPSAATGPRPASSDTVRTTADTAASVAGLLAATVRIHITDPDGKSCGSGTIVHAQNGEALVVTCGHIFRDSRGRGEILVDLFGPSAAENLPARLIGYDLENDVGLLAVRVPGPVVTARVAPPGYRVSKGARVITVGCNNGRQPTALFSRVVSLDRFLGPPNIEVAGVPVEGRSGGGLFSEEGFLIGVCNAADPSEKQGLYAALPVVHGALDKANLAYVYSSPNPSGTLPAASLAGGIPEMPRQMPSPSGAAADPTKPLMLPEPGGPAPAGGLSSTIAAVQSAAGAPGGSLDDMEIVCVIRSRSNPEAASEIVVLNHVSPNFVRQLATELQQQIPTKWTSFDTPAVPLPGPGEAASPAGRAGLRAAPPAAERRVLLEYRAEPGWKSLSGRQ